MQDKPNNFQIINESFLLTVRSLGYNNVFLHLCQCWDNYYATTELDNVFISIVFTYFNLKKD